MVAAGIRLGKAGVDAGAPIAAGAHLISGTPVSDRLLLNWSRGGPNSAIRENVVAAGIRLRKAGVDAGAPITC